MGICSGWKLHRLGDYAKAAWAEVMDCMVQIRGLA